LSNTLESFKNRVVDFSKAKAAGFDFDEESYETPILEKHLSQFELDGATDEHGYNDYSIRINLEEDKIIKVCRIAHLHMCGGQGTDDDINRFPFESLEEEAYEEISKILK